MKTLAIAAAGLAGGVALGATFGVVAADLITGKGIENRSITSKDIKKGSVPSQQTTGKRQHEPIRVRLFYRGHADSCTIGSALNPGQIMLENARITSY